MRITEKVHVHLYHHDEVFVPDKIQVRWKLSGPKTFG